MIPPDLLQHLDEIEKELHDCVHSVSDQIQNVRQSLAPQDSTMRRLSSRTPTRPTSPTNRRLKEPSALIAHRAVKAERKQQPKVAPTVTTNASHQGGDTQLRLHGRWMDLATQAAEAPTQDTKKKLKSRLALSSSEGDGLQGRQSRIWGMHVMEPFHPHGGFRICWDLSAMILIFGDTVLLPLALAWDVPMGVGNIFSLLLLCSFWLSLSFWTMDLFVNLNTATYRKGTLVVSRPRILISYVKGWLLFDILLLSFDVIDVTSQSAVSGELRLLRVTRVLRLLRLLRMLKLTKVNSIIEESAANSGRQWVTVVIAIVNTTVFMIVCVHLLTCMWWWVGRAMSGEDVKVPSYDSWVVRAGAYNVDHWIQYFHAMRWIVNSPSPPDLAADSGVERGFDIVVSIFVIAVIGSAVSKISSTLSELRAMNEARNRRRREVRQYLSSQHVSFELVSRIMRFVDYRLEKLSSTQLDTSLISPTLQLELYVGQRSNYVLEMPIFKLLNECYHDVFGSVCAALMKNVYEREENVFIAGSWVSFLHITATGTYSYIEGFDTDGESLDFSGTRWFGELSLFSEGTLHQSTLIADSFAETFSLSGSDLAECVKQSRGCMSMFCDYAKDFVSGMQATASKCGDQDQVRVAEECCRKNQHYQELYPDPKTRLQNILIPTTNSNDDSSCGDFDTSDLDPWGPTLNHSESNASGSPGSPSKRTTSKESLESVKMENFQEHDARAPKRSMQKHLADPGLFGWLTGVTELDQTLAQNLQELLPELNPEFSPHIVFEQNAERDRAESSCISIMSLWKDRYEIFTQPQAPNVKLRPEQWQELQDLIKWIDPDLEQIHAVLVLLAIRGLGKSKSVLQQMPRHSRRPEKAVLHLMESQKNVVPSVGWLQSRGLTFITDALAVHELFNLAQMLQGENLPANIAQLRDCIAERGQDVFRFYILFLLGFMSGIAAGQGSRFMNGKNASSVISGVRLLKRLMDCNPTAIYWGYLEERAQKLRVNFYSAEDLVLTRLSCLARAQDEKDYLLLRTSWDALKARERMALTDHFLADGIQDQAFVLEFLPNCMANAKANSTVGLVGLLGVLVDLLNNLNTSLEAMPPMEKMIPVDLSEMAEFIAVVQNRFVFLTCVSRCQLQFVGSRVYLKMTGGNWGRTADPDSDMTSLAYTLQDILQKQEVLEAYIMRKHEDHHAPPADGDQTNDEEELVMERVGSFSSGQEVRQVVF